MSHREELTGQYFMGKNIIKSDDSFKGVIEQAALNAAALQLDNLTKLKEEEIKREETWKDVSIMPFGFNIMIQAYMKNPYLKTVSKGGIILDSEGLFNNPDSGEEDTLDLGIPCARVVEVGPDVKHIKRGDDIIYEAPRAIPVPFMNQGFMLLNEGAVRCIINKDAVLKSRFPHLTD